jgi:ketosteroid isomerase-like protein
MKKKSLVFALFVIALYYVSTFFPGVAHAASNESVEVTETVDRFASRFFVGLDATAIADFYAPDAKIIQSINGKKEIETPVSFQKERTESFERIKQKDGKYGVVIKETKVENGRGEVVIAISLQRGNKFSEMTRYLSLVKKDGAWKIIRHSYEAYVPGGED